jgi:hypothetical protein
MATRDEFKVKLTGVHLCCQGCVNAADAALRSVDGVASQCDMEHGVVTVMASDAIAAQKGLDALAFAGFYGHSHKSPGCNEVRERRSRGQGETPESFGHSQLLRTLCHGHQRGHRQRRGRHGRHG